MSEANERPDRSVRGPRLRRSGWSGGWRRGTAVGALLALLTGPLSHEAAAGREGPGRSDRLSVTETDGETALKIRLSGKPTFTTYKLEGPPRVVVEVSGAKPADLDAPFDANTAAVGLVSAAVSDGESGPRTRVVIALRRAADYDVRTEGSTLVVQIRPHSAPEAKAPVAERAVERTRQEAARLVGEAETARKAAELARAAAEARAQKVEAEAQRLAAERAVLERQRERSEEAARAQLEERRRLAEERSQLEALRGEITQRQRALVAAEGAVSRTRSEAERTQRLAAEAEKKAEAARLAEETHGNRFRDAAAEVEARRRALESKLAAVEGQRERLAQAERVVTERERGVKSAGEALAARERAVAEAAERLEALRRDSKASSDVTRAQARLSDAERARKEALAASSRSRDELRIAVDARRQEEVAKSLIERERMEEERRLRLATEQRAAEEARRLAAERARRAEEERLLVVQASRTKAEQERARLEREAKAMAGELERLRTETKRIVASKDAATEASAAEVSARAEERARLERETQAMAGELVRLRQEMKRASAEKEQAVASEDAVVSAKAEERARLESETQALSSELERLRRETQQASSAKTEQDRLRADKARLAGEVERLREETRRLVAAKAAVAATVAAPAPRLARAPEADAPRLSREPVATAPRPARATASPAQVPVAAPGSARRTTAPALAAAAPALPPPAITPVKSAPSLAVTGPRTTSVTLRVPSRVQRIDFVDEPARSSVVIDLDEPSHYALERVDGRRVTLRLLHAELPRGLERSLDATEYLGPVRLISSYRDPASRGAVRVDVELAEDVPHRVRQDGSRLYWDFVKPALPAFLVPPRRQSAVARARSLEPRALFVQAPRVAAFQAGPLATFFAQNGPAAATVRPGAKKRYTGRRIDLDFKGADIHNILRLLSDVGGVNIVTSDDVKGEVTIKMRDVPWDQALDVVLRAKLLGQVREGNLIRVAPLQVLEKELEQEIARQKQITDVLPTETRLIGVSYADAKALQDRAKDLLTARGKISVDERTNTLIVSDVAKNLALVEELVRNLDTQTSLVVIEARIVEARSTFVRQIGVQWGGTGFMDQAHGNPTGLAFPYNIGIGGGATDTNTPTAGLVPGPRNGLGTANPNFAVNLPVAAGTGAGGALAMTLGSVAGAFNLNLRLSALESSGQVRILSAPKISTMDNVEASIEQGVSVPISVVSAQGVNTVFVDAKLNLTVKPHVTNEGTIMMELRVTRNEPDFVNTGARGDPTILKKEAKTVMLVRDGDTAVIGGIYQRNSGLNYAKVPFFADLPILGALFRNRRENDDRTEFLVFITPRVANRARAIGN